MDPDNLKHAWQTQTSQTRLPIDAEVLMQEVRHKQQAFAATIFWRDVRKLGISVVMVPLWIYLGIHQSLLWTWYLTVPALLWIAGFMLVDRIRHKRQSAGPGEPLRQHVEHSLAEVDHQIGLLRSVLWWYLLPLALSLLAFFCQFNWHARSGGWSTALAIIIALAGAALVFAGVYWVNQYAVRSGLEPRRLELQTLLASLEEATPDAS